MSGQRTPLYYHDPSNPPWQDPDKNPYTLSYGGHAEEVHSNSYSGGRVSGGGGSGQTSGDSIFQGDIERSKRKGEGKGKDKDKDEGKGKGKAEDKGKGKDEGKGKGKGKGKEEDKGKGKTKVKKKVTFALDDQLSS
ncbi:hypothetical protein CH063_07407 [Colletotrichum higginsianum]|uniref:Uncharacterized protein n=2 Tax=Colletotrichum higginsianum TaxID=80884 RepID=H1V624_COLHI|nr:hypothetical protein CH63R_11633 [Colletotrichum higginsianum IMI 349063]OBR04930.1 hypothetical protein CH63R_11633 [Colletotrichum higginsianum IMI 349063]TIC93773.1 hypothetical protein CH35J_009347 [Colletotrichum higginsianum]CCF35676.1 hypothetical protein CH063_07407 [Colletotrichum higginsianum]